MQKTILTCINCNNDTFAEGDCPNDLIQSTDNVWFQNEKGEWFCSTKCEIEFLREEN